MKPVKFIPQVLRWARERAGLDIAYLAKRFKVSEDQIIRWETTGELSLARAKKLSSYTHTPLGYLFLLEPLSDTLPIPDFRTRTGEFLKNPSPDLTDTIQQMQRRQDWMRELLIEDGADKLSFVGKEKMNDSPELVAREMRKVLGITPGWAEQLKSWSEALLFLRQQIANKGILIFVNGIVGNNTHRKLDPDEFRGFVLCDEHAPLVFINGADAKSAQMFTIAHELAHIWIGQEGVSNYDLFYPSQEPTEEYCNRVAAEFLVPEVELKTVWVKASKNEEPFQFLARIFKVSPLVTARRSLDLNLITRDSYFDFYNLYINDERRKPENNSTGGDFWNNQRVRIDQRFGRAVVTAAKEGRILYFDAYKLTGLFGKTFDQYANEMGISLR